MGKIRDIYDRIAKRCISLSAKCTVHLINGLYGTEYSSESKVTYRWTENVDNELKRTLADTIITINDQHSYHIEFQMTKDGDIILRLFEYGFHYALSSHGRSDTLVFPEPMVVYLYDRENFPDEYRIHIQFGKKDAFVYSVPVFKYLKKSLEELEQKKLTILLPFQLLRLRRTIEKERTQENIEALKKLIRHDILDSINRNLDAGNITQTEAAKLAQLTLRLYHHIYQEYEELEKEGVNQMAEEALILDVDILEYKIKTLEGEKQVWKLKAQGNSMEKIAEQTGFSPAKVQEILTAE
ncbi:MAG: hypothetical protein Q4C61_05695 [Lachnospiraceae bacterium]|nr:hypothetical protein [Lachnospiraceae bacterium]